MGINNEGIANRRQLLVKAGSFMKLSWRKSRESLISEDGDNDDGKNNGIRQKRSLSVRFSDNLVIEHINEDDPVSDEEKQNRWYQSSDYSRFKKDTILSSLNYINAKRALKPIDENVTCIMGIESMCILNPSTRERHVAEQKYIYKVIREEQARQMKDRQQRQEQEQQNQTKKRSTDNNKNRSSCPDLEKFRSVSVYHTKGARDRALFRGNEYARAQQRSLGSIRTPTMKNLFASFRAHPAKAA